MKQPSEEDFKAHALVLGIKHMGRTHLELVSEAIKFGYQLALQHATSEVAKATEDLKKFRASRNAPQ